MWWKVEVLEKRLVLSAYYDYDVIAKVGDVTAQGDTIASFKGETSINDSGRVAFVANVTGGNGNGTAVIAANAQGISKISFANPASGRQYDFAQIADDNQVISRDLISSTDLMRTWNALSTGTFNLLVKDGDPGPGTSPPTPPPYEIVQLGTRANDGGIAYIGNVENGPTAVFVKGASHQQVQTVSGGGYRPMAADGGAVTWRTGVSGTQEIYVAKPSGGRRLAGPDFTAVGQPGISDDGTVVAFAGDSVVDGKGIFLSYFDGTKYTDPIKVAGSGSELGIDPGGNGIFLNDFDFSTPTAPSTLSNRVGVVHQSGGVAGIEDDTIVLTFIATPSAASRPNPQLPAKPLLFSANQGIWTMKIIPDKPLSTSGTTGTIHFNRRTSPMPVVQIGDLIGGRTITGFTLFDPLTIASKDQDGAARATVAPGDHYVVFHATTNAGDEVVRAAQFDTDGDGLFDHWERGPGTRPSGVDIDGNGTPDLDISSMGADPMHKDLFLEVDWLKPDFDTHRNFAPTQDALQDFVDLYANSPLTNPDGTTGANMHIDAGASLSQNMGTGSKQGGDQFDKAGKHIDVIYFGTNDPGTLIGAVNPLGNPLVTRSMDDIKKNFFGTTTKDARELVFRYCVFSDYCKVIDDGAGGFQNLRDDSGLTEVGYFNDAKSAGKQIDFRFVPGNDMIVTLQGLRNPIGGKVAVPLSSPTTFLATPPGYLQSQTLAHEFGHALGLHHGGFDNLTSGPPTATTATTKPTYRSVMNYAYQFSPDTAGTLIQDYARTGDAVFDDWSNVSLGFSEFFDTLGTTRAEYTRSGATLPDPEPPEFTVTEITELTGPLDGQPPELNITSPAAAASIPLAAPLTVNISASDNGQLESVIVSFDANGDGTISASEKVTAASTGPGTYQAVFNGISGPLGGRDLTALATDAAGFSTDQTLSVTVTGGVTDPPKVLASSFLYATLPHKLSFKFDQNVGASLAPIDFFVRKTDGTGQLTPTNVTFDDTTNTATVSLPGQIPDGRYIVTLSSIGISSASGQLDGDGNGTAGPDFDFNFLFATGDADNDGEVGFTDLVVVAQNYGHTQTDAKTGDLNYDSETGFADLVLVAQHYGSALAAPLPAAALPVAASPAAAPLKSSAIQARKPTPAAARKPTPTVAARPTVAVPVFYSPAKRRGIKDLILSR